MPRTCAGPRAAPSGLKDLVGRDIPRGDTQVWLLPMDGGEARQLTDLPDDVGELAWSPDGTRLCVVSGATSARPPATTAAAAAPGDRAGDPPRRDIRLIDELDYQLNGVGFTYERPPRLWIVDVTSGEARRITSGLAWRRAAGLEPGRHAHRLRLQPRAGRRPGLALGPLRRAGRWRSRYPCDAAARNGSSATPPGARMARSSRSSVTASRHWGPRATTSGSSPRSLSRRAATSPRPATSSSTP